MQYMGYMLSARANLHGHITSAKGTREKLKIEFREIAPRDELIISQIFSKISEFINFSKTRKCLNS